ncbi:MULTISPECIES: hypothetical protein [Vibrio]|uniref:Uncharacterized protein n=2 Tax=Vibrio mediterranei TaxID=689 RepID=A0AAN1FLY2_9VIBR|nr:MULTISPECIES: hypothetical protein [Vibrio]ASI93047.1 hypothetical protein BSZ05_25155 [Vibrio mediterranei]KFA98242.1 hypothetical protein HW45_12890 [Vibrio sp. ER1A]MCG9658372.1 hypothetical protein [Vibrio mediterranei]MCG9663111.1 hypothetical protein [Vibrio mediterranei]SBO11085.1 hypothetical protein VME0621_03220 [Vibrio mediterranei]
MFRALLLIWSLAVTLPVMSMEYETLSIDQPAIHYSELAFPNSDNIQPNRSDFSINNYVLMSSESGERWAVVTVTNTSSAKRTINQTQLVAILANGERIFAEDFHESVGPNKTTSLTINFGWNKFPILSIYSRH